MQALLYSTQHGMAGATKTQQQPRSTLQLDGPCLSQLWYASRVAYTFRWRRALALSNIPQHSHVSSLCHCFPPLLAPSFNRCISSLFSSPTFPVNVLLEKFHRQGQCGTHSYTMRHNMCSVVQCSLWRVPGLARPFDAFITQLRGSSNSIHSAVISGSASMTAAQGPFAERDERLRGWVQGALGIAVWQECMR